MNDSVTTPAGNGTNKPSHVAYQVRDGKGDNKSFWTRIGVAWTSRDEKGFVIQLNAVPLDGKIILRVPEPKETLNHGSTGRAISARPPPERNQTMQHHHRLPCHHSRLLPIDRGTFRRLRSRLRHGHG